jgi:hypothetical protein
MDKAKTSGESSAIWSYPAACARSKRLLTATPGRLPLEVPNIPGVCMPVGVWAVGVCACMSACIWATCSHRSSRIRNRVWTSCAGATWTDPPSSAPPSLGNAKPTGVCGRFPPGVPALPRGDARAGSELKADRAEEDERCASGPSSEKRAQVE